MSAVVANARPAVGAHTAQKAPRSPACRIPSPRAAHAGRHASAPTTQAAVAAVLPAVSDERAAMSDAVKVALARLAHPSALQPATLVPTLEGALSSLSVQPGGRSWERAVLASPALLGLLSLSTELLEQPAVQGMGPEAPLLVLEVLSYMGGPAAAPGMASRQSEHCRSLWRRAHAALGEAADVAGVWDVANPGLMTPDMIVRYYEAAARSPFAGAPSKSRGLGLLLRHHLHASNFSTAECVRLLAAWAHLRRRMPFNPDAYNFADVSAELCAAAPRLTPDQLVSVSDSAPAFQWPVYRSIPVLHAVSREAVHRSLAGALPLPIAQRVLAASAKGAAAMRPRLGHDLEEASAEWMRTAPGVRNNSVPVPPSLPGAAQQQYAQPPWARGRGGSSLLYY